MPDTKGKQSEEKFHFGEFSRRLCSLHPRGTPFGRRGDLESGMFVLGKLNLCGLCLWCVVLVVGLFIYTDRFVFVNFRCFPIIFVEKKS